MTKAEQVRLVAWRSKILQMAGAPRKADGTVDVSAPTPRTADGKPDFSGIWTSDEVDPRRPNNRRIRVTRRRRAA